MTHVQPGRIAKARRRASALARRKVDLTKLQDTRAQLHTKNQHDKDIQVSMKEVNNKITAAKLDIAALELALKNWH